APSPQVSMPGQDFSQLQNQLEGAIQNRDHQGMQSVMQSAARLASQGASSLGATPTYGGATPFFQGQATPMMHGGATPLMFGGTPTIGAATPTLGAATPSQALWRPQQMQQQMRQGLSVSQPEPPTESTVPTATVPSSVPTAASASVD
ncbi:unnamed protein product, partial [Polarella glacialis]